MPTMTYPDYKQLERAPQYTPRYIL